MNRYPFNRLWFQFSAVIAGVVVVVTVTLVGVTYLRRPNLPVAERPPQTVRRVEAQNRLSRALTQDTIVLILSGGVLAIAAGVYLSRRMTAPLEDLTAGATAIGAGDLAHRVSPTGSAELVALATSFNQMAANLEGAEQLRRNLLADVAHELRTPLTVLQGNLRAILDDVYALDKTEVARLYDQTRQLNRLVNDLHELAQAEANQLPLHLELFEAGEAVRVTVEVFEALFEAQQVRLALALPPTPAMIWADRARITQVLQNLLTNALRHTSAGDAVSVDVTQAGNQVRIDVQDTGTGIEAEHLPYIFNRFYRADRVRDRDSGGVGLGLALVRAIVETHHGQVSVHSAGRGQGSTFTVLLPVAASTNDTTLGATSLVNSLQLPEASPAVSQ